MAVSKEQVLAALAKVPAPGGGALPDAKVLSDIVVGRRQGVFLHHGRCRRGEGLGAGAQGRRRGRARAFPACNRRLVALTAERAAGAARPQAQQPPAGGAPHRAAHPADKVQPGVPGVEAVIAVASGKGGVGKSTTAVNLALGLRDLGLKVGVLDADIYGPSLPKLLAIKEKPQTIGGTRLKPIERYGLTVMSIGFLIDEETPMIWRGPMVMSAITQMLREVEWGKLDVMVVDMPPGTGDAQLTMAQQVPLKGAVIVSTPQDLALLDARRGVAMFKRVNVPVLGVVENMSYFLCPKCGERSDIFSHGGARKEADAPGRAVPRRGAARHGHPREVGCRPAGGRHRAGRPARQSLPRHRRQGLGSDQARRRCRARRAQDRDRGLDRPTAAAAYRRR